jgi:hypothetical protein
MLAYLFWFYPNLPNPNILQSKEFSTNIEEENLYNKCYQCFLTQQILAGIDPIKY